ncbi:MAG: DsbA family oxidoreductase [Tetrasphaera jenkinsii]|jgi:predicted DsbA family dithiol-disulfide isomerase|nr:DsbA family oxidoreductase [Tetrasphaera jenkinsii]
MRIDVWSDIVCPFCHLGRRHLELALAQFEHRDEVGVIWHSFELDRNAEAVQSGSVLEKVAAKYGAPIEQMRAQHEEMAAAAAAVGLDFQWERLVGSNSYAAHRLLHFARSVGRESEVTDRIMRAWYSEGQAIGDPAVLQRLAVDAGLDEAAVADVLASDDFGIEVRTDEALATQIGITGVPTFVLDQKYAVTGAQPVELMLAAIRQAWDEQGTRPEMAAGGGCGGGCCGGGCGDEVDDTLDGQMCSTDGSCGGGGCGCDEPARA